MRVAHEIHTGVKRKPRSGFFKPSVPFTKRKKSENRRSLRASPLLRTCQTKSQEFSRGLYS